MEKKRLDLDKVDPPWPQKGDELFVAGEDWWHNACLNYLDDDWDLYANGYRQAADTLVGYVKETHRHRDTLVFPIVFLYRQYLELRLKQLIRDGHQLFDQPPSFPRSHEVDKLWTECRRVLCELEPQVPSDDLEAVDEAISQFSVVDPTSQVFRYPTDKKGKRSLPPDLTYINLRNLAEVMEKVSGLLEAAAMMMSVYLDTKEIHVEGKDIVSESFH